MFRSVAPLNQRTRVDGPLLELVDFLRTTHGVQAETGAAPGRVTASSGGRDVAVVLVGQRWFRETRADNESRTLSPIHPRGMEWSVARVIAEALTGDPQ